MGSAEETNMAEDTRWHRSHRWEGFQCQARGNRKSDEGRPISKPNVNETPFDKSALRPYMIVFDTVYNPENTLLLKEARSVGCRTATGVEMFVRQAMLQFEYWHGKPACAEVIRDAIKSATASHKPVG